MENRSSIPSRSPPPTLRSQSPWRRPTSSNPGRRTQHAQRFQRRRSRFGTFVAVVVVDDLPNSEHTPHHSSFHASSSLSLYIYIGRSPIYTPRWNRSASYTQYQVWKTLSGKNRSGTGRTCTTTTSSFSTHGKRRRRYCIRV